MSHIDYDGYKIDEISKQLIILADRRNGVTAREVTDESPRVNTKRSVHYRVSKHLEPANLITQVDIGEQSRIIYGLTEEAESWLDSGGYEELNKASTLSDLARENERLWSELDSHRERMTSMDEQIDGLRAELSGIQGAISSYSNKMDELESSMLTKTQSKVQINREVKSKVNKHLSEVDSLAGKIDRTHRLLEDLQDRLERVEESNQPAELEKLRTRVDHLEEQIEQRDTTETESDTDDDEKRSSRGSRWPFR
ncbi:hypothetical protein RYH80_19435 [Halobaculum sp. MBLA0147]|uniref:hypothetical protein n=1 Tax=Halobaculum sp. MBLA0147 TaxID=3079934 RepID=UPI0035244C81